MTTLHEQPAAVDRTISVLAMVLVRAVVNGVMVECRDVGPWGREDCCGTLCYENAEIRCNECGRVAVSGNQF